MSGLDTRGETSQIAAAENYADVVLLEKVDAVRVVTLNRPAKRNAANFALQKRLLEVIETIAADPDARAVVLTGAGQAFCAGGDRDDLQAAAAGQLANADEFAAIQHRTVELMLDSPIPMIAAVNGAAAGHGAVLVALCDLVVLGEGAALWDPHVQYGMRPCVGLQLIWPLLTSTAIAKELLMTSRRVGAEEALRLGLGNTLCPAGEELATAMAYSRTFAEMPPQGITQAKRCFNQGLSARYHEMISLF